LVYRWCATGSRTGRPNRGGRTSSDPDRVHVETWPLDWTIELSELLTVLRRLVALEPAQADLLDHILTGPLLSVPDLRSAGVLPVPDVARRARRPGPLHTRIRLIIY
jgi:hypothetical protein